jgi:hypothetical protein
MEKRTSRKAMRSRRTKTLIELSGLLELCGAHVFRISLQRDHVQSFSCGFKDLVKLRFIQLVVNSRACDVKH